MYIELLGVFDFGGKMNFRKATKEDVKHLAYLRKKQLIDEGCYSECNIDDELERYFSVGIANKGLLIWLAIADEDIIGTAGVCFFQYPPSFTNPTGKIAYITNVYTRDEYRNRGIATKLLELVLEEIKAEGCMFARLHASAQGRGLYEKMGFVDAQGFMSKNMI